MTATSIVRAPSRSSRDGWSSPTTHGIRRGSVLAAMRRGDGQGVSGMVYCLQGDGWISDRLLLRRLHNLGQPQRHRGTRKAGTTAGGYLSDDFQAELAFLGMTSSPSFVREPEGNGV